MPRSNMETAKIAIGVAAFVALADIAGFLLWQASGQVPPDAFHVGAITEHIIKAFI